MVRRHGNVGSFEAPLQKAPEVLHTVSVNMALYVLDGMIHELMQVFGIQAFIRLQGICKDFGSLFNICSDDSLQQRLFAICDYAGADLAATLQNQIGRASCRERGYIALCSAL